MRQPAIPPVIADHCPNERGYLMIKSEIMDTVNTDVGLRAIKFELDDYKCVQFFDQSGNLSVLGPNKSRESLARYVSNYAPLCRDRSLREFLAPIRPTQGWMKSFTLSWT